ncbi:MAG: adenosine nucleotide hydrolase, partial [Fibrobacter sp.]|nr:adenosine nucleotide hydrolase [Fibrobacter sp.]
VVVNCSMMPSEFLGREIDPDLIGELERIGVDPCGENGEYHTFVYDGPLFRKKINLIRGESFSKEKYCFLPLRVSF